MGSMHCCLGEMRDDGARTRTIMPRGVFDDKSHILMR